MKLTFYGAARQVTGSCFLLETKRSRVLIDCGLFQGSNFNEGRNHDTLPFNPKRIDAVFVTHAHIDHTGRIPLLVKFGFKGRVFATRGGAELMRIVWRDAVKIMKYEKRKFGLPMLYDAQDVALAAAHCRGVNYRQTISGAGEGGAGDISVTFHDAGHIFGSSFLSVSVEGKRLIFSGDLGNADVPILRDTEEIRQSVDALIIESTYGDRLHESSAHRERIIREHLEDAIQHGGTLLIPAFSIERTQELLYEMHEIMAHKKAIPRIPIYLDSPMAIDALPVYRRYPEYYDREARELKEAGDDFFKFPGLKITRTKSESKAINSVRGSKIIIAGSGMMNGGRIVHHALRHLGNPHSTFLIVGYCAEGTLGRRLYEGASQVTVLNQKVEVRARVQAIGAFSAHADQKRLLWWAGTAVGAPRRIYTVHGEPHAQTELAHRLRDQFYGKSEVFVPEENESVEL